MPLIARSERPLRPCLALSTVLILSLSACGDEELAEGRDLGTPVENTPAADSGAASGGDDASLNGDGGEASLDGGVNTDPPPEAGLDTLYMGHSFGRPFAEQLTDFADRAGIPDHHQQIVFGGGSSGSPRALWDHPARSAEIKRRLESGQDVLVMICCSEGFVDGAGDPAIRLWIDYALSRNPNTRIVLALPWLDFPERYPSAAAYEATWEQLRTLWHAEIETLRAEYPGVDITSLPHGRASIDLRIRFEAGTLPDVEVMTGRGEGSLFTDEKGHAGQTLRDLGTLVWLGALYPGADLASALATSYQTDLVSMAQAILIEDPFVR
ncbi:MAG: hypothetical protein AAFZ18_17080 [Myxococcota bacterium]